MSGRESNGLDGFGVGPPGLSEQRIPPRAGQWSRATSVGSPVGARAGGPGYNRGVAQPGSAPALGAGGRRFKSSRPDHRNAEFGMRTAEFGVEFGVIRTLHSAFCN